MGLTAYVCIRWLLPSVSENALGPQFRPEVAALVASIFAMLAFASVIFRAKRQKLVDMQRNLETLRATPWKDFEYLVAEAKRMCKN